jgi:hypothetical protein
MIPKVSGQQKLNPFFSGNPYKLAQGFFFFADESETIMFLLERTYVYRVWVWDREREREREKERERERKREREKGREM